MSFEEQGDVQDVSDHVFQDAILAMIQNSECDEITPEMADRFASSAALMAEAAIKYRPVYPSDDEEGDDE